MHPGVLILVWLGAVASLQLLPHDALLVVTGGLLVVALALARQSCGRLLRRIRFLLLAIVILFAGFTPGEVIFPDLPRMSPSREGVILALEHAGRVLAVVCCVALLLRVLPAQRLVGGLHALLRPLESLGFPAADRVAVRTLLVLEYVQTTRPREWREWLRDGSGQETPVSIHVSRRPLRYRDLAALLLTVFVVAALIRVW